jgi:hypothetical protein
MLTPGRVALIPDNPKRGMLLILYVPPVVTLTPEYVGDG